MQQRLAHYGKPKIGTLTFAPINVKSIQGSNYLQLQQAVTTKSGLFHRLESKLISAVYRDRRHDLPRYDKMVYTALIIFMRYRL